MRSLPLIVAVSLVGMVAGCVADQGRTPAGSSEAPEVMEEVAAHELAVGLCLNDVSEPLGAELTEIPSVDCTEPHESEVFAEIAIDAESYPGVDVINDEAATECERAFGEFIGLDYRVSALGFHYYYPEFSRWAEGSTSIYCVAFDPEGPVEGSLKGVAR